MITYQRKEQGVIASVFSGFEDHGILTAWVQVDFDGSTQGFGGVAFETEEPQRDFIWDLCKVFGVPLLRNLVDRPCVAYYAIDRGSIDALGPPDRPPFELYEWRRKHWPDQTLHPVDAEILHLSTTIASLKQQVKDFEQRIRMLRKLPRWNGLPK